MERTMYLLKYMEDSINLAMKKRKVPLRYLPWVLIFKINTLRLRRLIKKVERTNLPNGQTVVLNMDTILSQALTGLEESSKRCRDLLKDS